MNTIYAVLPALGVYLKKLENFSDNFPVCCQESSLILCAWLIKNKISCALIAGYHDDEKAGHDTFHLWVETDEVIVDGTAIQFIMPEHKPRTFDEIEPYIHKVDFCYNKNTFSYKDRVDAYVDMGLLKYFIEETRDSFDEFMDDMKVIFENNSGVIKKCMGYMAYSSMYKIDKIHYGLNLNEFYAKFGAHQFVAEEYTIMY